MKIDAAETELLSVPIDLIDRNPENPRILFRQSELEELLESIRRYGVQVPISVYKEGKRFVLIDGERRWRCSLKLNKRTIPALIQEKPTPLNNLLLMFNIHSLREQWDLLTIALKLPRIINLLEEELGAPPNERDLSNQTGLSRGVIRRCKLLIDLPENYKNEILNELNRPKPQQRITEDFFIEMERALKTVERAMPDVIDNKDVARRILIDKYKSGVISNIIQFRKIPKIARAEHVDVDKKKAKYVLKKLFQQNTYSIEEAYDASVSEAYTERDLISLISRINSLLDHLSTLNVHELDDETRASLKQLINHASAILEGEE